MLKVPCDINWGGGQLSFILSIDTSTIISFTSFLVLKSSSLSPFSSSPQIDEPVTIPFLYVEFSFIFLGLDEYFGKEVVN